jgi:succinyl-CoA synthetase alpha subunit
MSVLLDANTKILVQGITGTTGRLFAERMKAGGTPVVGGVTPGKGGSRGRRPAGVRLDARGGRCDRRQRRAELHRPGVTSSTACSRSSMPASRWRCSTSRTSRSTTRSGCAPTRRPAAPHPRPNSAGVVSPGLANMADLNDANLRPGRIGIVSKSGTLTYEIIEELHQVGLGESTVVCLGGDRVVGTRYDDVLRLFEADPDTDLVVVIGEPGGGLDTRRRRWRRRCARRSSPTSPARAARRTRAWAMPAPSSATTCAAGRRARWRLRGGGHSGRRPRHRHRRARDAHARAGASATRAKELNPGIAERHTSMTRKAFDFSAIDRRTVLTMAPAWRRRRCSACLRCRTRPAIRK